MKKKHIWSAVVLGVVILCWYVFYNRGDNRFETKSWSNGVAITRYKGTERDVVIPEKINGKKVLEISGTPVPDSVDMTGAFENNNVITSVTIPATVTRIGRDAFKNCSALTTVIMPDSVSDIDVQAFQNCAVLAKVRFPKGLMYIGESAFEDCKSLTSVDIPEANIGLKIYLSAFKNCSSLERVSLPRKLEVYRISDNNFPFTGCLKIALPTGNESFDRMMSIYTVLAKQSKTLEDHLWLREQYAGKGAKITIENYALENANILPKISPEFGSRPNGKIFFLERQDFGNKPNVVYARFDYLDHLLGNLPKELAERYSITTTTAEVEYVILFSTFLGESQNYIEVGTGEKGYLYETTFVADLYKVDKATGIFKRVRNLETVENKPAERTSSGFGAVAITSVEPRLKGYFDSVRAMK